MSKKEQLPIAYAVYGGIKDAYANLFYHNDDIRNTVMPDPHDGDEDGYGCALLNPEDVWYGGIYNVRRKGKEERIQAQGHCFTVPYAKNSILDTVTDDRMFICMETYNGTNYDSKSVRNIIIQFNVFCHKDALDNVTDKDREFLETMHSRGYRGNRIDIAVAAIMKAVETTQYLRDKNGVSYGIGRPVLLPRDSILVYQPNMYFFGKQIFYQIPEIGVIPTGTV